jgi:hypothetical protein
MHAVDNVFKQGTFIHTLIVKSGDASETDHALPLRGLDSLVIADLVCHAFSAKNRGLGDSLLFFYGYKTIDGFSDKRHQVQ